MLVCTFKCGLRKLLKRQTLQTEDRNRHMQHARWCKFSGYFITGTYFPFHPTVVIRRNFAGNIYLTSPYYSVSHDNHSVLCTGPFGRNTKFYSAKHVDSGFFLTSRSWDELLFQFKTMEKSQCSCNTYHDFHKIRYWHISYQLKHCGYIRNKLCRQSWNTGRTIEWLLERVTNLYVIRYRHFNTDINLVMKVVR